MRDSGTTGGDCDRDPQKCKKNGRSFSGDRPFSVLRVNGSRQAELIVFADVGIVVRGGGIVLETPEGSEAHDLGFGFPDVLVSRPLSAENVFFLDAEDDFIGERICVFAPLRVRFTGVLPGRNRRSRSSGNSGRL